MFIYNADEIRFFFAAISNQFVWIISNGLANKNCIFIKLENEIDRNSLSELKNVYTHTYCVQAASNWFS